MQSIAVTKTHALDQPALRLTHPSGAEATVLLYGGHVVSFRTAGGRELLYLSPLATTAGGKAVRGGVPLIFPQFDRRGPEPGVVRHGFARTRTFAHAGSVAGGVELELRDDESTRESFPYPFRLTLGISLGADQLRLALRVQNLAEVFFAFTGALHTYLRVDDIAQATVHGLGGCRYEDQVLPSAEELERADTLRIEGEVDRIYAGAGELQLREAGHVVRIEQRGFDDTVVWNPGPERAAALADLPDDGYRRMLCIEAARVHEPVTLGPGECFDGVQTLTATSG